MGKVITNKKKPNLSSRKKKAVDMNAYAGKVKAYRDVDAKAYQQKIRE
jgi:hypothetical protein